MLISLIVVIISQCIHILNHYVANLKYTQLLNANMSILLENIKFSIKNILKTLLCIKYVLTLNLILLKLRATPVLTCTCSSVYLPITVFGLSWHSRKRRVQTSKMVMEFTGITQ